MWLAACILGAIGLGVIYELRMLRRQAAEAQDDNVRLLRVIRDQLDEAFPASSAGKNDRAANRLAGFE